MNDINTGDITLVVQGAINPSYTKSCLESYRKYLPNSKIILSTWEGSNVNGLDYDVVVFNKDPGSFLITSTIYNNIDRQIISTINGLKQVKTKYAFKIRTDFELTGNSFLKYFNKFTKYDEKYKIVKQRVLISTIYARNPNKIPQFPFHISDFAFFGITEDLIDLFDIELTKQIDKDWCKVQGLKYEQNIFWPRFVPEQHIFISFLKKHNIDVKCQFYCDVSEENIKLTELYIVNNFTLINIEQFNLLPFKKEFLTNGNVYYLQSCYTHYDFLKMYKKYCNNKYLIPLYDKERISFKVFYKFIKRKILKPFLNIYCVFINDMELKHKIRQIYK